MTKPHRLLECEFQCPECGDANIQEVFRTLAWIRLSTLTVTFTNGSIEASKTDYADGAESEFQPDSELWYQCRHCCHEHRDLEAFIPEDIKLMAPSLNSLLNVASAPDTQPRQGTPAA